MKDNTLRAIIAKEERKQKLDDICIYRVDPNYGSTIESAKQQIQMWQNDLTGNYPEDEAIAMDIEPVDYEVMDGEDFAELIGDFTVPYEGEKIFVAIVSEFDIESLKEYGYFGVVFGFGDNGEDYTYFDDYMEALIFAESEAANHIADDKDIIRGQFRYEVDHFKWNESDCEWDVESCTTIYVLPSNPKIIVDGEPKEVGISTDGYTYIGSEEIDYEFDDYYKTNKSFYQCYRCEYRCEDDVIYDYEIRRKEQE